MKIAILTSYTYDIYEWCKYPIEINRTYAYKHQYTFIVEATTSNPAYHSTWNKVFMLKKHLCNFDWCFWIDADACFLDHSICLESFMEGSDFHVCADFHWVRDPNDNTSGFNCGTMLIKNTTGTQKIIEDVLNQFVNGWALNSFHEQTLFNRIYRNNKTLMKMHPQFDFNGAPPWWPEGKQNTFVMHLMGRTYDERLTFFKKIGKQFINEKPNIPKSLCFKHFVKENDIKNENNNENLVKKIHQTWKDTQIPYNVFPKENIDSWLKYHWKWEYRLWTDNENLIFVKAYFPEFLKLYESYNSNIKRADVIRYFILYKFGGLYADLDCIALKSLAPILETNDLVFGIEPGCNAWWWGYTPFLSNALMYSKPYHNFWEFLFDELHILNMSAPMETGPGLLTRAYEKYIEQGNRPCYFLDNDAFLWSDDKERQSFSKKTFKDGKVITDKTYVIHDNLISWR